VLWLRWLATGHWPVQVRFLMEIVALGQVFFYKYFHLPLSVSFHHCSVLVF